MKLTQIILIVFAVFNCSDQNNIAEFERILGKKESQTLTQLVLNFENSFLKKEYPELDNADAYLQLVKEINDRGDVLYWKEISTESDRLYKSSDLWQAVHGNSKSSTTYDKHRTAINPFGKYAKALSSIKNKSNFLRQYLKGREASGDINPAIFLHKLLNSNVDYDDYFVKRLIVTELVY